MPNGEQAMVFAILICLFGLLIWGRWRYDVIAFGALVVALIVGVVPAEEAFSGFGHPATVIIALVLIVSRGLANFRRHRAAWPATAGGCRHALPVRRISASWARSVRRAVGGHEQCGCPGPADAAGSAGGCQGQAQPGAHPHAALLRLDSGRPGDPDRHAAQHHHRLLPRRGDWANPSACSTSPRSAPSPCAMVGDRLRGADRLAPHPDRERATGDDSTRRTCSSWRTTWPSLTGGSEGAKAIGQEGTPRSMNPVADEATIVQVSWAWCATAKRLPAGDRYGVCDRRGRRARRPGRPGGHREASRGALRPRIRRSAIRAEPETSRAAIWSCAEVVVPPGAQSDRPLRHLPAPAAALQRCTCWASRARASACAKRVRRLKPCRRAISCCHARAKRGPAGRSRPAGSAACRSPSAACRCSSADKAWPRRRHLRSLPSPCPASACFICRWRWPPSSPSTSSPASCPCGSSTTHVEWPVIVLLGSLIPIGQALETSGGTALIAGALVEPVDRPAGLGRADPADGHHHDPVRRHEQHGDRRHRRAHRRRHRRAPRGQSRRLS